jgi:RNA polymerase sigma-70 factor (ECF subfamily)
VPGRAYARTKRSLRQPMVDRVLAGIASDLAGLTVSRSDAPNGPGRLYHQGVSTRPDATTSDLDLEPYRRELTAYCYRMLGSGFEAEDAVQDTMVRAWKAVDRFEGRSALRSWLYRIATNVCLDMLRGPQRRAHPMDLGPSSPADTALPAGLPENTWVMPVPDSRVLPVDGDPAEIAASRDTIRLAFVAALQHLPPRQRAVLILREVLRWQAAEVAELLDTSVASVNSALQRARATLDTVNLDADRPVTVDADQQELLARYVDAFERYDITSLVSLLHEDASFTMPPYPLWLRGPVEIGRWYVGQGIGCQGARLVATAANGCAAFASYKVSGPGTWEPFNVHVVEVSGDRISGLHHFLYPELFPAFGLPARLER